MGTKKVETPSDQPIFPPPQRLGQIQGRKVEEIQKKTPYFIRVWEAIKNAIHSLFSCFCFCNGAREVAVENPPIVISPPVQTTPIEKPTDTTPSKPVESLYEPLKALKDQREKQFEPIRLPAAIPHTIVKPDGYPLLETYKSTLGKVTSISMGEKKFSEANARLFSTLIKGVDDPSQIGLVFDFCKERIEQFNGLAQANNQALIDSQTFFDQFFPLKQAQEAWETLATLAQKTELLASDLELLEKAANRLPLQGELTLQGDPFYKTYPFVAQKIGALVTLINTRPVIANNPNEQISRIKHRFVSTTVSLYCPSTPQGVLKKYVDDFMIELGEAFYKLFARSEEAANKKVDLTLNDIEQMYNYLADEGEKLMGAVNAFVKQYPNLEFENSASEAKDIRGRAYEDVQPLVDAWRMMKEMLKSKNVDEKIALLSKIAKILPDHDSEKWKTYPLLKEAMGDTLVPLSLGYFSSYTFQLNNAADKNRIQKINENFKLMATKLGCKEPPTIEIDMDTTRDDELAAQEIEAAIEQHARALIALFNQNSREFGEATAAQWTAENINLRFRTFGSQSKDLIRRVLNKMPPRMANVLRPHFPD